MLPSSEAAYAANAPTAIEGAACWQAAMLCIVPGFAGPQLDVPAALRVAEGLGAEARVAIPLLGMIGDGMQRAWRSGARRRAMADAVRRISVRLSLQDDGIVERQLEQIGRVRDASLDRLKRGAEQAGSALELLDFARQAAGAPALGQGHAGIVATAQTDFDVRRNGTSIGTVRFPAGSATATFIAASAVTGEPGDRLAAVAPATPDATFADIAVTLAGALAV
jgi:hypothetical protein